MKQEQGVKSALENSCAVLAAYCRADSLTKLVPEEHMRRIHELLQNQVSGGYKARQQDWLQERAARRQKVLVGLVRASSDRHFVGTLDSIMVHPGLRRRGLGRRCAYTSYSATIVHQLSLSLSEGVTLACNWDTG